MKELPFDTNFPVFHQGTTYIDANANTLVESYGRLQMLYGFSRALCGRNEPKKIPEVALEALSRLINMERGFIALYDKTTKFRVLASHNIELDDEPVAWPVSKTIITQVITEGLPVLSSDAVKDDRFANIHTVNLNRIRSVICVPLGIRSAAIGMLYVDNRLKADSFSQADLLFLVALSHYIYLAIRNVGTAALTAAPPSETEQWVMREMADEHNIISRAPVMFSAYQRLRKVAGREVPILLLGETGTGKELFARAAHKLNEKRANKKFFALNIAALSETLIESELFGHEKGAFSNATYTKNGKFELAHGGTLFLDEVAEIPLNIQPKLLRVLETGQFERVGGTKQLHTDIRLVCATNKNLEEAVKKGAFRDDLYYRIKGVTVSLPPLRDRREDIPDLVGHTLTQLGSKRSFSTDAFRAMQNYHWPGNVRQLIRLVEEVEAISDDAEISPQDLPDYLAAALPSGEDAFLPLNDLLSQIERDYIQQALTLAGGNNERAIEMLGISRAKFFDRKKVYGLS